MVNTSSGVFVMKPVLGSCGQRRASLLDPFLSNSNAGRDDSRRSAAVGNFYSRCLYPMIRRFLSFTSSKKNARTYFDTFKFLLKSTTISTYLNNNIVENLHALSLDLQPRNPSSAFESGIASRRLTSADPLNFIRRVCGCWRHDKIYYGVEVHLSERVTVVGITWYF